MDLEMLKEYGLDPQGGLARCMGDRELYTMMLRLFLEDDCLDRGKAALAEGEYRKLFQCMHELKGACGNVEMTDLFALVGPLVEILRKDPQPDDAEIRERFAKVETAYLRAREGITLASER